MSPVLPLTLVYSRRGAQLPCAQKGVPAGEQWVSGHIKPQRCQELNKGRTAFILLFPHCCSTCVPGRGSRGSRRLCGSRDTALAPAPAHTPISSSAKAFWSHRFVVARALGLVGPTTTRKGQRCHLQPGWLEIAHEYPCQCQIVH